MPISRAERLLNLIEEFRRRRRPVSGEQLADALGVSIRTMYRDIASLRALGADIQGEPGLGFVLRSGFLLPPVMFTAEEVDALVLERRMVNWNHRTLNNCHSRERGNPGFPHAISLKVWFPAFAEMTDEGL